MESKEYKELRYSFPPQYMDGLLKPNEYKVLCCDYDKLLQFIKENFIPKSELEEIVEITELNEFTPDYEGYSDLVKFGRRFFRTRDAENYLSSLDEIDEHKYNELLKYKDKS